VFFVSFVRNLFTFIGIQRTYTMLQLILGNIFNSLIAITIPHRPGRDCLLLPGDPLLKPLFHDLDVG
jgi:hypothetical protein